MIFLQEWFSIENDLNDILLYFYLFIFYINILKP
jgi:hypothetical protein